MNEVEYYFQSIYLWGCATNVPDTVAKDSRWIFDQTSDLTMTNKKNSDVTMIPGTDWRQFSHTLNWPLALPTGNTAIY